MLFSIYNPELCTCCKDAITLECSADHIKQWIENDSYHVSIDSKVDYIKITTNKEISHDLYVHNVNATEIIVYTTININFVNCSCDRFTFYAHKCNVKSYPECNNIAVNVNTWDCKYSDSGCIIHTATNDLHYLNALLIHCKRISTTS